MGIVALVAVTMTNAAVNVTSSSITCKAGNNVGVLGAGSSGGVTWENVTISAAFTRLTLTVEIMLGSSVPAATTP